MKLRYFVGTPEDAFRKHDVVFTSADAADTHAMKSGITGIRSGSLCDMLFVYRAKTMLHKATELALVLDMNDLCDRYTQTYPIRLGLEPIPSIYTYFEEFADRLLRFRRMAQKLKEAA